MDNKISLGDLVVTRAVDELMQTRPLFKLFVNRSIQRFSQCNWGNRCDRETQELNKQAMETNTGMIHGIYHDVRQHEPVLWIIHNCDTNITTVLLPSDY
ncbi:MAG: hypothetical protein LUE31_03415 [Lachnospiraceae bacterium]|nr:hypothetical protein [Lachnospiraceae bacterium]